MSAKISLMTVGASSTDSAIRTVGVAVSLSPQVGLFNLKSESHEVLEERACVALV